MKKTILPIIIAFTLASCGGSSGGGGSSTAESSDTTTDTSSDAPTSYMTSINTGNNTVIGTTSNASVSASINQISGSRLSADGAVSSATISGVNCKDLTGLTSNTAITEGRCIQFFEPVNEQYSDAGYAVFKEMIEKPTASASNISGDSPLNAAVFSDSETTTESRVAILEPDGDVRPLLHTPKTSAIIANAGLVTVKNNLAVYIGEDQKLYRKDLSIADDTVNETVVAEGVTHFDWDSEKELIAGETAQSIKAGNTVDIPELNNKQMIAISGGFLHEELDTDKGVQMGRVDGAGGVTTRHDNHQQAMDLWIAGGAKGAPPTPERNLSLTGATRTRDFLINRDGRAYRIVNASTDIELFTLCGLGHCRVADLNQLHFKQCGDDLYIASYSVVDGHLPARQTLSHVTYDTLVVTDLSPDHRVTELSCRSNGEVGFTGLNMTNGKTETYVIENANTAAFKLHLKEQEVDSITQLDPAP